MSGVISRAGGHRARLELRGPERLVGAVPGSVTETASRPSIWRRPRSAARGGRPKLRFAKQLKAGQLTATNTGRTLKVTLRDASDQPAVQLKGAKSGLISGKYILDNLHLHWNDPAGGRGSEHKMNGAFEQAEAHFVFFNQNLSLPTLGLDGDLPQLSQLGSSITRQVDLRPLRKVLRTALKSFYSYKGSLTTPPCSPVVTWIVHDQPVSVEATFLQDLRSSLSADLAGAETIQNNWRELQPLNGREVVRYTRGRTSRANKPWARCSRE
ncbi:Carbonic anhydrase 2 [Amphibalanus amphitrite]|uniref:Carbonic anhydrase 2 n=1 Tax=Amphibalanus amphitrite TaxID=1232801 RepID=A0A6A4XG63_AMPAM|nr:Carbonic anhydrase 2 [Amphibalanus amphitrite]